MPDSSRSPLLRAFQERMHALLRPLVETQAAHHRQAVGSMEVLRIEALRAEAAARDTMASVLFSRWLDYPDELGSRKETGQWLNWLGLGGAGVEVGVYRGDFSEHLLRTWDCTRLTSVDPWREFPSNTYLDVCNLPQVKHEENYSTTVERLKKFGERSNVLRQTSAEAAAAFEDGSLDFVYLDAQHHYEAVRDDIGLWHPKVRVGGVIGGHDYMDGDVESGNYGVKRAVDEFASARNYRLILTREPNWRSWYTRVE